MFHSNLGYVVRFPRYSVSKNRDFEIRVRGYSRSLKVVSFDRLGMVSYKCSIVTLSIRYLRYWSLLSIPWPRNPGWGYSRSSEPTRTDPLPMTFYWRSIITMGLSSTVSEIDGDFSRKSQISPPLVYILRHRWRNSPRNWVSALLVKKLEWWCYQIVKKF